MLRKLTKLVNKFYLNWKCIDFCKIIQYHFTTVIWCCVMHIGLLCTDMNTIHTMPHKRPVFVNPPNFQKTNYGGLRSVDLYITVCKCSACNIWRQQRTKNKIWMCLERSAAITSYCTIPRHLLSTAQDCHVQTIFCSQHMTWLCKVPQQ